MSKAWVWLRRGLFWLVPIVVLLIALLCGFLYWVLATPAGTRWALHTAVHFQKGQISGIKGSLWHGLEFAQLHLPLPEEIEIDAQGFVLEVDWPKLWQQRTLDVKQLKAAHIGVFLPESKEKEKEDEAPFEMPALPIAVQVEALAVGEFALHTDAEPFFLDIGHLQAQLSLADSLDVQLQSLHIGYEEIQAEIQAQAHLPKIAAPWPADVKAQVTVSSQDENAPICAKQYLPEKLHTQHLQEHANSLLSQYAVIAQQPPIGLRAGQKAPFNQGEKQSCQVALDLAWQGSLAQSTFNMTGQGQGFHLNSYADLQLESNIPVTHAVLNAQLPDGSSLDFDLDWLPNPLSEERTHIFTTLKTHEFDAGAWLADLGIESILNVDLDVNALVDVHTPALYQASVGFNLREGSIWNGQPANGHIALDTAVKPDTTTAKKGIDFAQPWWLDYVLTYADADLSLGNNQMVLSGRWAQSPDDTLSLNVNGPSLDELWPGLEPIGQTEIALKFSGDWARHRLQLNAGYRLSPSEVQTIAPAEQAIEQDVAVRSGQQPLGTGWVRAEVDLTGGITFLDSMPSKASGVPFDLWHIDIQKLKAQHAAFTVSGQTPGRVKVYFDQPDRPMAVDVGAWTILTQVEGHDWLTIVHEHSHWQGAQWSTKGHTEPVRFSARFVDLLMRNIGLQDQHPKKGGIVFTDETIEPLADIELQMGWDLVFKEALGGSLYLRRVSGDIMVPDEPPVPLGLEQADLTVNLTAQGAGRTEVNARLSLHTKMMGYLQADLQTPFYFSPDHGFEIRENDLKTVTVDAQMDDLSWTQLIVGDAMELRGELDAHVEIQMRELDNLSMRGDINGNHLRVTRLDDGVRLLDGTLRARLDEHRFIIDELHFPALLRVEPKEWRTATWITEEEDAQGGYLDLTGYWDLEEETGHFKVILHRYPILQRSDRYAMMSGELTVDALLPQIDIKGKLTADAGWFDLDMLGGIPTIDSDVVVIRAGDEPLDEEEAPSAIDMAMDIEIDLGPRFYLTGYGVNSGLVGQLRVMMVGDQLTGLGALRTRGGAIEIYGQRLQLRRGTITFQGDIANPILNIEALRTGLAVEAGVRVAGTARKPKIDLVSYPEVDELEKLSWLLFGHGPDESGGDVALLISVGTSMLSDGEPFYKRFGIDELSLQSGDIGGAGSVLPPTSTASSLESEVSEVEKRFIQASKVFGQGFTVGVRQALADSGTVGRATYRLSRRLTAEISLGTVNGMALLYRWFSRDN